MEGEGMRVTWGGVRGSCPVHTEGCEGFGGATTALMVESGDPLHKVIIDAGSGLAHLTPFPTPPAEGGKLLMLFTHFHLDHLMGLPAFPAFYDTRTRITLAAPELEGVTLEQAAKRLVAPPYWPITPFSAATFLSWTARSLEPFPFGPFAITWMPVAHPNGCVAYRIEDRHSGHALVFATDFEWPAMDPDAQAAFLAFCGDAPDLLVLDGHFDGEEAQRHAGWGHNTWQSDVEIARQVNAKRLLITHHAPHADDALLENRQRALAALFPESGFARMNEVTSV